MSRSLFGVSTPGLLARRAAWLPAAAVMALPFFSPGSPVSLVSASFDQAQQLTITGSIDGLREGVRADLTLTLRSRSDGPTAVHSVTVRVTGASPGCPSSALWAGTWSGALVVPAHGEARASVPVTLHDPAGACRDATWQLAYTSA